MLQSKKSKVFAVGQVVLVILVLSVMVRYYFFPNADTPEFQHFVEGLGFYGYLIVIVYIIVSHVLAPVSGTPGVLLASAIYGIHTGMWLLYAASMVSAVINFHIARRWGRSLVTKIAGEKAMREIDDFTKIEGREALVVSRVLGMSFFDFISYASGLTNIRFRDYMWITALAGLVPNLAIQLIFKDVDLQSGLGLAIWLGSILVAAVVFGVLIKLYLKRRMR